MRYVEYISLLIATFILIKIILSLIDEASNSLKNKILEKKINSGFLSIKDIQKKDYSRFIDTIYSYLSYHNYEDIVILPKGTPEETHIIGSINNEKVFISCIQNDMLGESHKDEDSWTSINRSHVQCFVSKLIANNCKKGLMITNSVFTKDALSFYEEININSNNIELNLVNGYELTRSIRNYNNILNRMESCNED